MNTCNNCGKDNRVGQNFCNNCGKKLNNSLLADLTSEVNNMNHAQQTLHNKEQEYLQDFEKMFEVYDQVQFYLDMPPALRSLIEDKRTWIERLRSPEFPVAFLGTFSVGKSTIINAIIGKDILPEDTKSCTAIPTIIKKGDRDYAVVHYLDERARVELKEFYIEEIANELNKARQETLQLLGLAAKRALQLLQKDIETYKRQIGHFNADVYVENLIKLVDKWHTHSGKREEIPISQLPQYVTTSNPDVLLIEKTTVFLTNINLPKGVVLTDLPGLGVTNPRHKEFTRDYVVNQANAFVMSTAVFKVLEGEEFTLLTQIHKKRPKVLNRAFWVINQWDNVKSDTQRNQTNQDFNRKVRDNKFNITPDRVYRVSALNYLLLKLISDNNLQNTRYEGHVNSLGSYSSPHFPPSADEARKLISSIKEVSDFERFRKNLFDYLNHRAREEFLEEVRNERDDLLRRIRGLLKPLHEKISQEQDLENRLMARQFSSEMSAALDELKSIVEREIREIRTNVAPNFMLLDAQTMQEVEKGMSHVIDHIDRVTLKNELMKKLDLDLNFTRLAYILESHLHIVEDIREKLQDIIQAKIVDVYSKNILYQLQRTNSLPGKMASDTLEDILGNRDMSARVSGLGDILLFDYGDVINHAGIQIEKKLAADKKVPELSKIKDYIKAHPDLAIKAARVVLKSRNPPQPAQLLELSADLLEKLYQEMSKQPSGMGYHGIDDRIEKALQIYQDILRKFITDLQQKVNKYAKRSIKNYYEELEQRLLQLFEDKQEEIAVVIWDRVKENLKNELDNETRKREVIENAYQALSRVN